MSDLTPLTYAEFRALKKGDKLLCVNDTNIVNADWYPDAQKLQLNHIYIIQSISSHSIYIQGINFGYMYNRFALYALTPKGNQRREI